MKQNRRGDEGRLRGLSSAPAEQNGSFGMEGISTTSRILWPASFLVFVFGGKKIIFSKVPLTDEDVGDRPHPLLRHHDPDDDEVAARGDRRHRDEEHRPYELPPPREDVRVHIVCVVGTR